ncbi:MAG: leucine-rich repeat domain-containing protein [Promethearchaeota archaeon]
MIIPKKIFLDFQGHKISKELAINQFISLIENANDTSLRLESLQYLVKLSLKEDFFYSFLENLAISDCDVRIRRVSYSLIRTHFMERALDLIQWALENEEDYDCLLNVMDMLKASTNPESKKILTHELEKIIAKEYLSPNNAYPKKKFRKSLLKLALKLDLNELSKEEKVEIIVNYLTILELFKKFYTIYFELEDGVVTHLDFSDVGWNANLLRLKYTAWISDVSEIKGLKNLKRLKSLDLSNNQITNIKDLVYLKNLETLLLSNNKICDPINQYYLKQMPLLKYVDLSGNKLAKIINIKEYPEMKIIRYKSLPNY